MNPSSANNCPELFQVPQQIHKVAVLSRDSQNNSPVTMQTFKFEMSILSIRSVTASIVFLFHTTLPCFHYTTDKNQEIEPRT